MFSVTKTVYNVSLAAATLMGISYRPLPNTTLNEKFNVVVETDSEESPKLQYFTIGLQYEELIDENVISLDRVRHSPTDAALFNHVPFVLKRIEEDLTADEREDYRLRSIIDIDNVTYVAYYMKKLRTTIANNQILKVINTNGTLVPSVYEPQNENPLSPVIVDRDMVYSDNVEFVTSTNRIDLVLNNPELENIKEAMEIMYPDITPRIGEIGVCSGLDVSTPLGTESAWSQVNYMVKYDYDLSNMTSETVLIKTMDLGGMQPLITNN